MVNRRTILKGAAAGSIAAIASAHGVAAAPDDKLGVLGAGFGTLEDGGLGAFHKVRYGYDAFCKWHKSAAQVFYKENQSSGLDVFLKFFKSRDGWGKSMQVDTLDDVVIGSAAAGFIKLDDYNATLFLKYGDGQRVHYLNINADGDYEEDFEPPNCYQLY
jgi:hypothetical protein